MQLTIDLPESAFESLFRLAEMTNQPLSDLNTVRLVVASYFVRPLNPPILGDFEVRTHQSWRATLAMFHRPRNAREGAGGLNRTVLMPVPFCGG